MPRKLDKLAEEVFRDKYSYNKTESLEQAVSRYTTEFINKEIERFQQLYTKIKEDPTFKNHFFFGLSEMGFVYYNILVSIKEFDIDCVRTHIEKFLKPMLSNMDIIPGGSGFENIGINKSFTSLSNCFVIESPQDSIEEILKTGNEDAQLMKRRGGVGQDLSDIRPKNSPVRNAAKTSSGVLPFMDIYSTITNAIAQDGRRGAMLLSLSVKHPDIKDFIESKQDLTKVTGANISVKITNKFMEAVVADDFFYLQFPITDTGLFRYGSIPREDMLPLECREEINEAFDGDLPLNTLIDVGKGHYIKKVRAREIWDTLIKCAWKTAEPGILFEDNHINYSPDGIYDQYKMKSTNPCGEIGMQPYDSCRLIHHNYLNYVNLILENNYKELYRKFYIGMITGDILVDLEIDSILEILSKIQNNTDEYTLWTKVLETTRNSRRSGVGFTGLWDLIILTKHLHQSDPSIIEPIFTFITRIQRLKFQAELDATIDMAILYGSFKGFDGKLESEIPNDFFKMIRYEFPNQFQKMIIYGRRNISFNTVAPTGTISIIAGCTSGIEPLFLPYYERKVKVMNDSEYDFKDKVGEKFKKHIVIHPPFLNWIKENNPEIKEENLTIEELDNFYKISPYYGFCATDISIEDRIRIQSIVQRYTTHSISSTINLKNTATVEEVSDLYMKAHQYGLKGITVYRDGSRDGILTAINNNNNNNNIFEPLDAIKRPKELDAKLYTITKGGIKYAVIVGLLQNRPYEVFAISIDKHLTWGEIDGKITKKRKGVYSFISEEVIIENLQLKNTEIEEKAFTIFVSMLLRSRNKIPHIIKTMDKIDDNISSFSKAIQRILSKFIPPEILGEVCPKCEGKLIRTEGCIHCLECDYSKC